MRSQIRLLRNLGLGAIGCIVILWNIRIESTLQDSTRHLKTRLAQEEGSISYGSIFDIPDVMVGGEEWDIWRGTRPYPSSDSSKECEWAKVIFGDAETEMCLHSGQDVISNHLRNKGKWAFCDVLLNLWDPDKPGIILELGANIGACTMHLLFLTTANLVVFEPNPDNLFCLTSTLLRLDEKTRARVVVFPIAAGDSNEATLIHTAKGNYGNANVGRFQADFPNVLEYTTSKIRISSLDLIFSKSGPFDINLLKMDVQGYECKALDGMLKILPNVNSLKAKMATKWLENQDCSEDGLFQRLDQWFELFNEDMGSIVRSDIPKYGAVYNIVGKSKLIKGTKKEFSSVFDIPNVLIGEDDWHIWRGDKPYPSSDPSKECKWTTFKSDDVETPMCVHSTSDAVSNQLIEHGKWNDCNIITSLWDQTKPGIYLELGVNIGACMMQVLLTTNAKIIVFEPNPENLFCLTSTLLDLDEALRSRVVVFPIGAGDTNERNTIYAAKGNFGNGNVGQFQSDRPSMTEYTKNTIHVRRLDDIFSYSIPFDINVLKMDVQGYECRVLDGMESILPRIRVAKTEVAVKWLENQKCSVEGFFNRLENWFQLVDERMTPISRTDASKYGEVYDIVGITKPEKNIYGSKFFSTFFDIPNVLVGEDDWNIWGGDDPYPSSDTTKECEWTIFRINDVENHMCVHSQPDMISKSIHDGGKFGPCQKLTDLWDETKPGIYLELGANIGACMMQMLITTTANIVVFEPNPDNLFCLTSTLLRLDEKTRARVVVFPIAAGDANEKNVITTAQRNYGNGNIGRFQNGGGRNEEFISHQIRIKKLDDIFRFSRVVDVNVFKIDVQGYECKAFDGMMTILPHTRIMRAKVARLWLDNQGCSVEGLFYRFGRWFNVLKSNRSFPKPMDDHHFEKYNDVFYIEGTSFAGPGMLLP